MNASIPKPIQIVIDDVGWWSGEDGSSVQDPFRTGFCRNHVPVDYQAIVDLGKRLGMRPQAAMILCEWDRTNRVAQLPSASRQGTNWDNSQWVGPWLEEAAAIIRDNQEHFEVCLHGIGHEYWTNGSFTRGEWYDPTGKLRPIHEIKTRLELYDTLMRESELGPFPESFVPPSFTYIFSPEDSLVPYLKARGIRYVSTPFHRMMDADKVQGKNFGVEERIINVDRGQDLLKWNASGQAPEGRLTGPICGMHWPSLLHKDPDRNGEIIDKWVEFLEPYDQAVETMLARDTRQMATQLVYHECAMAEAHADCIELDFSRLNQLDVAHIDKAFTIRIEAAPTSRFAGDRIEILSHEWKETPDYHELQIQPIQGSARITLACPRG